MYGFPLPGDGSVIVVPAPGEGDGWWAGAPAALLDADGSIVLAYRVRNGHDGYDEVVVARSPDGVTLDEVLRLREDRFGAAAVERPALARTDDGLWRLYVCGATPDSKHWWTGVLEASTLEDLADAALLPAFPGDATVGIKDPVVRRSASGGWEAWVCCHPLDIDGAEDRMVTAYATSPDGLDWTLRGDALRGRPGLWDARGARVTTVLPDGTAAYDGRASAAENWFERIGLARRIDGAGGTLEPIGEQPSYDARYLEVLELPGGGHRIWFEARLDDLSHELRTELFPAS